MTSVNAFTPVYANSSLIEYAGEWNRTTWPYRPLSTDSRASLSFTGNGIAIMGSGDLGSNSATGGVNLYVDQGSSHPGNYSTFGSAGNDSTSALGRIRVPAGSHTASFGVNGEEGLNLLFGGFEISDGMTNIQTDGTIYAGGNITDIQYFNRDRDPSVSPDGKDGRDVTYVTGPDSGFAMNFTGLGVAVYTAFNASESTTYSVYFNQSAPPSQGEEVTPFDTYTLIQGTGGLLFHAGALPGGQHRLLIVNTGSGRLGFQSANSLFPDFPLYNSTVCYVNCTQEERDKLTGTDFAAVSGSPRVLGPAVGLVLALSFGLSLGQVVL